MSYCNTFFKFKHTVLFILQSHLVCQPVCISPVLAAHFGSFLQGALTSSARRTYILQQIRRALWSGSGADRSSRDSSPESPRASLVLHSWLLTVSSVTHQLFCTLTSLWTVSSSRVLCHSSWSPPTSQSAWVERTFHLIISCQWVGKAADYTQHRHEECSEVAEIEVTWAKHSRGRLKVLDRIY